MPTQAWAWHPWLSPPKAVKFLVQKFGKYSLTCNERPRGIKAEEKGFLPSQWALVARDAFNSVVLWRRPIGSWQPYNNPQRRMVPADLHRRLVADKDRVYVTLDLFGPTVVLDAATGQTVMVYKGTKLWKRNESWPSALRQARSCGRRIMRTH